MVMRLTAYGTGRSEANAAQGQGLRRVPAPIEQREWTLGGGIEKSDPSPELVFPGRAPYRSK